MLNALDKLGDKNKLVIGVVRGEPANEWKKITKKHFYYRG